MTRRIESRRRTVIAAIILSGAAPVAHAQAPPHDPRVAAIEGVILYRRLFLNDTSSFELCALSHALRPLEPPFGLTPFAYAVVDTASWCRNKGELGWPARSAPVGVEKIAITSDSTATVVLAIYRGEYSHSETYALRRSMSGDWGVTGVLLSAGEYAEIRSAADTQAIRPDTLRRKTRP
jgi:hypothetical protein